MRMTQCTAYKNHFYDADKYSSCPHCAKLGTPEGEKKGFFSRRKQPEAPVQQPDDDKTVMLTNVLDPEVMEDGDEEQPQSVSEQVGKVAVSGTIEDIKTVAMYGFEDDESKEPVVGWLVAVSGNEKGRSFELRSGKNTVGRDGGGQEVDIALNADHKVSRGSQAVVIYEPIKRQFLIQSSEGSSLVYHNGELLMSYKEIAAYDKITIGETTMRFVPFCCDKFSWEENE